MSGWVAVAVLGRVRGNRGELTAIALSNKPERYQRLTSVSLVHRSTSERAPFEVETVWTQQDHLVFKFAGIDSISAAEPLQGSEVQIPASERLALDPGEFYDSDLIGCEVFERPSGESLGLVAGLVDGGGSQLLQVGDLLIPFATAICVVIDPLARRIEVDLPEGLKEINRS